MYPCILVVGALVLLAWTPVGYKTFLGSPHSVAGLLVLHVLANCVPVVGLVCLCALMVAYIKQSIRRRASLVAKCRRNDAVIRKNRRKCFSDEGKNKNGPSSYTNGRRCRSPTVKWSRHHERTTLMLVAIIVGLVFTDGITSTWLLVVFLESHFGDSHSGGNRDGGVAGSDNISNNETTPPPMVYHFKQFYNLLIMLGSFTVIFNFIIYCTMSSQFKNTARGLLRCQRVVGRTKESQEQQQQQQQPSASRGPSSLTFMCSSKITQ